MLDLVVLDCTVYKSFEKSGTSLVPLKILLLHGGVLCCTYHEPSSPFADTSHHSFLLMLFLPEMSSLQTRGRKLKRVVATRHVGGGFVGPKPGACSDGQKPTDRQCSFPALYSADAPVIAQRPWPSLWGRRCRIISSIGSVWGGGGGGGSPGGHPGVGATPFLGGRPSAGAESGVVRVDT